MEPRPPPPTLRDWLRAQPFTLGLSSGFFGFFAHAGFVAALEEAGLRPARACGSSAGALVAGLWSSGLPAASIRDALFALRREQFWDPAFGPGLLRGAAFERLLHGLLPVPTFEACPTPLAVSAFDVLARRTRVLDRGPLAAALRASCSVPFLFHPVWIDRRPHADGGVLDRHGLAGAPPGARVLYHHLASRSPWRREGSPALRIPAREGLAPVVIDGLPRLGPFRLERGREAFARAQEGLRAALDRPVPPATAP